MTIKKVAIKSKAGLRIGQTAIVFRDQAKLTK